MNSRRMQHDGGAGRTRHARDPLGIDCHTRASRENSEDVCQFVPASILREFIRSIHVNRSFPWSALRPKNPDFRYILRLSRKQLLFMAEFVAEAISKCTIHKRPLFFGFATCAFATLACRPMIRHLICNGMLLSVRNADKSTRNTLAARRLFGRNLRLV